MIKIKLSLLVMLALCVNICSAQILAKKSGLNVIDITAPFDSSTFFKTFKSGYDSSNGIRMHYVIGGSGKQVIVLLHGFPEDWYAWRKIMPVLAKEYTVIAPDLRGFGLSDKPKKGYSKKNLAKDVYGLIHDLGYKNIYLAGYDFGSLISYAYTCQYPDDVKKLVVFESGGPAGLGMEKLMDVAHGGSWHFGFFMAPVFPEMLIKGKEKEFFKAFSFGDIVKEKTAFSEADIAHYIQNLSAPDGLAGAFEYYRSYTQDVKDNFIFAHKKIAIPVLAMDGLLHGLTKQSMEKLAAHVSGNIIEKSGHWLAEERPNDILKQIRPFFHSK